MGLADVTFNRNQSGIGRPLPNYDHISSLLFYTADAKLPSGFTTLDRIKVLYSVTDAENLGITDDFAGETKPTGGNILITAIGANGDTFSIKIDDAILGTYTKVAGDTLVDDVATAIRAAINALTSVHGYVAGGTNANVLLTAPDGLGVAINAGNHLALEVTGTAAGTVTQFTGGVGDVNAVMHYHISEYFRMQPEGKLFVGIYTTPSGAYDGTGISLLQNYANGEIRQMGIFLQSEVITSGAITLTQEILTTLETAHKPMNVLMHIDCTGKTLITLSDLSLLTAGRVSVNIGSDGNWHQLAYVNTKSYLIGDKVIHSNKSYIAKAPTTGNSPFDTTKWVMIDYCLNIICGYTISTLGNQLGLISYSSVHENEGWVQKYNIASGNTLDVPAFVTGDLYSAQTTSLLNTINNMHYVFIRNHTGISGTYYNDSWTCIANTNDFCRIESNRTMDKAIRNIRTVLLPDLLSPLYVDETTGMLSEATIAIFKNKCDKQLELMQIDGEISGGQTIINPSQDVITTSQLTISIEIVPVGSANAIVVNIGFVLKLT